MADRTYGSSFNQNKASPAFIYVEDSTLNGGSGAWRPANAADFGGGGGGGGSTDMTATNTKLDTLNSLSVVQSGYHRPANKTCSIGFTGSLLGKAATGELHSVFGYNSGVAQYLRVHDGSDTTGAIAGVIAIGAADNFSIDFAKGMTMANGIFVSLSSSPTSAVASGNDAIITITWK